MANNNNLSDAIRNFWDAQPCGTTHLNISPDSLEYFTRFDMHYNSLYPYLMPFLNIDLMRGKRVMEIGIGSGCTLQQISMVAEECFGLDLSIDTIRLNENRKKYFGMTAKLLHASATSIPLPDNSLDYVVSIGCLHHIPSIEDAISEIHRVLKPGGIFKGMVYNKNSWRYRVYMPIVRRLGKRWKDKSLQDCINQMYDGQENPYGMVYSKREIKDLFVKFTNINFKVENFVGSEFIPFFGYCVPRCIWLATLGKIFGLDLYFTAKVIK